MRDDRSGLDPVMKPLARRVNLAVWLDQAVGPAAILMAVSVTAHLVAKMVAPDLAWSALGGLALLPLVFWGAWLVCRRRGLFFCPQEVAEVVDHLYRNDGSVTAVYERPTLAPGADYYRAVRREVGGRLPRIRPGYYGKRLAPVLIYGAAALAVPPRASALDGQRQEALNVISQPLAERLEAVKEVLPEEKREELEKELKEVAENGGGISKEQWEALEELEKRIENAAAQGGMVAAQAASAMSELASMVGAAGAESADGMDAASQSRMEELVKQLSEQASDRSGSGLPLSPDQLKKLQEALGQCKGGRKPANPGDLENLKKCLGELAKDLQNKCQGMGNCNGGDSNNVGRGGRNRGRADAPYVLGEEQRLEGAEFQDQALENMFMSAQDLADLGVLRVEPKPDPGRFSPGTVKSFAPQSGTHVSRTRIGPSQREVIAKYFGGQDGQ